MKFHITKKRVLWSLGIALVVIVVLVAVLEIASRNMTLKRVPYPNCSEIAQTYNKDHPSSPLSGPGGFMAPQPSPIGKSLRDKRAQNISISGSEYDAAANELVHEVRGDALDPLNGISCGEYGFVRDDLPHGASLFVKRHELEHLLQEGMGYRGNPEFNANLAAAKAHPIGLIETIFFSVIHRARYYDSFFAYLVSAWVTFKKYFLP